MQATSTSHALSNLGLALVALILGLLSVSDARATVIGTVATSTSDTSFTVSTTDLIETGAPTLLGIPTIGPTFTTFGGSSPTFLNDGTIGASSSGGAGAAGTTAFSLGTGYSATFTLNLNSLTGGGQYGYEIKNIQSFAGWDVGRGGQDISVSYTTTSNQTVSLGPFTATGTSDTGQLGTRLTIADDTLPVFASHVKSITVNFLDGNDVYREVDVIGAFSTPEPSSMVLAMLGLASLVLVAKFRRGRQAAAAR